MNSGASFSISQVLVTRVKYLKHTTYKAKCLLSSQFWKLKGMAPARAHFLSAWYPRRQQWQEWASECILKQVQSAEELPGLTRTIFWSTFVPSEHEPPTRPHLLKFHHLTAPSVDHTVYHSGPLWGMGTTAKQEDSMCVQTPAADFPLHPQQVTYLSTLS